MGPGAPSEPCDKIVTEPKFVAAWLDNGTLNDLVVKAGQTARMFLNSSKIVKISSLTKIKSYTDCT